MAGNSKITVCHIASGDLWAGAEVQLFTLLEALAKEPTLALSAVILNNGKLAEKLGGININLTVLDEKTSGFFGLKKAFLEKLTLNPVDIIHSHRYKENILAAFAKKHRKAKRLVQTVHGLGEPHKGLASLKTAVTDLTNRHFTNKYFDKVISVSEDIEKRLHEYYGSPKVITIHNAVDPVKVKPARSAAEIRNEFGIAAGAPLIGAIGRMVPVKAYDTFLSMAVEILKIRPDCCFLLVGDGPLKDELLALSHGLGIDGKVIFTGFRDDVLDLVNALDIFVISSLHEGIPMALLEAMALKKAIVSTAVGGINEVIRDGKSGLHVKPRDPQALASACVRVITESKLKSSLEIGARARLDEEFSIITLMQRVMTLYGNLLDGS
jgi:L-malate glycosyltransferase